MSKLWLTVLHVCYNDHFAHFVDELHCFYCAIDFAVFVSSSQVNIVHRMQASSVSMSSTIKQLNKLTSVCD